MKRALVLFALGFGLLPLNGCGSDDDSSSTSNPVTACKEFWAATCAKFFGCFSKDELAPFADYVGNNEADCKTKFYASECSSEKVKCDSGESYDPSAAKECINQFKAFSCDQFSSDTTASPAACDQLCK